MGNPKFDVLAQMVVAPTGTPTTVYQPPVGRAGVLAGVRILMKFPKVEAAGGYIDTYQNDPEWLTAKGRNGDYLKVFDNNDYVDSNRNVAFFFRTSNNSFYHNTENVETRYPDNKFKYSASRSVFNVIVGTERVTGNLVIPSMNSHMDIKVPVVSNKRPLKILNGVFLYNSILSNREQAIRNHYKRASHLAVTVFGQEVDQ